MKCVDCSISELNKIILSQSVDYIIRVLFWYMHVIILHLSGSEERHLLFAYKNISNF